MLRRIVSCQNASNFEDGLKQLGDQVPDLKNFNQSNINIDDMEKALKEKCEKRGAPNAVELLKMLLKIKSEPNKKGKEKVISAWLKRTNERIRRSVNYIVKNMEINKR